MPVATPEDRGGRRPVNVRALLVHDRLMDRWIERIADFTKRDETVPRQDRVKLIGNGLECTRQVAVLARPVNVIQHRQQ